MLILMQVRGIPLDITFAGNYNSVANLFDKGFNETVANTGSTSTLISSDIGADPFMNKTFCESFKIIDKKTYVLTTDHPVSLELKDTKYKKMKKNQFANFSCLKGWTTGFLVIARGVPNGSAATDVLNLSFSYRRKYCVNLIEDSTDRSGQIG